MTIPLKNYADQAVFDEEVTQIFSRQMFAGHQSDIPNQDDYFSFRVGKKNLSLRNFGNQNSLLSNVCRHRFNLIDPAGFGNRKFRCGYHGWTYGCDGAATFIPLRDSFKSLPDNVGVETFPLDDIHGGQFMLRDPQRKQSVQQVMDQVGAAGGPHFHRDEIVHECNWKLVVENVLEGYHLSFVHAASFTQTGFTSTGRGELVGPDNGLDTFAIIYPDAQAHRRLMRAVPGITPSYKHLFVFPNLFISVGNELIYYVAQVMPVSPTRSVLHYRLFPTAKLMTLAPGIQDYFKQEAIGLTAKTLDEDRRILETNQIGIASATQEYLLADCEVRIQHFHDAYKKFL